MPDSGIESGKKPRLDIVGGGISGLLAAQKAVEAGYDVHVHEASANRLGGKIESAALNGTAVNAGAEFVDTDHKGLIEVCENLKKDRYDVNLIPADDQSKEKFQIAGGSALSGEAFYATARSLQQKIVRDKAIITRNPNGALAQQLDALPLKDYLTRLGKECDQERGLAQRTLRGVKRLFGSTKVPRSEKIAEAMASMYGSEAGQDPRRVSALQFVNEANAKVGSFLASDCGLRVEGGTETIIQNLQKDLESKGVHFEMNSKATSVTRSDNGTFHLTFANPDEADVQTNKVVLALPMHALGNLGGLESLGFSEDDIKLLRGAQYTSSAKFTIKTNAPAESAVIFSGDGFQAWSSSPDTVTFLAGSELTDKLQGKQLVDYCTKRYAIAHGVPEGIFDTSQMVFSGPDKAKPCYASAAPGQVLAMQHFAQKAQYLADDGVGVVGTYLPLQEPGKASIGFMECGVQSVNRIGKLFENAHDKDVTNQRSFVDMLQNKVPEQRSHPAAMMR